MSWQIYIKLSIYFTVPLQQYDTQIAELRVELQKEMAHEPAKSTTVKPQIKQPKVSTSKTTIKTPTKQRPETDSSGPDSSLVSPVTPESKGLCFCIYIISSAFIF